MAQGFKNGFGAFGADGITRQFSFRLILYGRTADMPPASSRWRHHLYVIEDATPGTMYQTWICKNTGQANSWQWIAAGGPTTM